MVSAVLLRQPETRLGNMPWKLFIFAWSVNSRYNVMAMSAPETLSCLYPLAYRRR
jgi:hypothetical protein